MPPYWRNASFNGMPPSFDVILPHWCDASAMPPYWRNASFNLMPLQRCDAYSSMRCLLINVMLSSFDVILPHWCDASAMPPYWTNASFNVMPFHWCDAYTSMRCLLIYDMPPYWCNVYSSMKSMPPHFCLLIDSLVIYCDIPIIALNSKILQLQQQNWANHKVSSSKMMLLPTTIFRWHTQINSLHTNTYGSYQTYF